MKLTGPASASPPGVVSESRRLVQIQLTTYTRRVAKGAALLNNGKKTRDRSAAPARTTKTSTIVAPRRYPTPLRYPGGKQRLGIFFASVLHKNDLVGGRYVEPFAGGAGAGLYLLRRGLVEQVYLNDADRSLYAFWVAVKEQNAALCAMIENTPITLEEWDRQKAVQRRKRTAPLFDLGFSTLFLNRTNRSGILRAGVIGGREQTGKWHLDARFNRQALSDRISTLQPVAKKIHVSCLDAVEFLKAFQHRSAKATLVYLDPPYFVKGRDLYLNRYGAADHVALANWITSELSCPWIITYDDVPAVRKLYGGYRKRTYGLTYTADTRRQGREVMVVSSGLKIPRLLLT